jgi:hypothetical protein
MFQHVTVLVSFIFAIALTHVFSSASQLLLGRDRVRFHGKSGHLCQPQYHRLAKPNDWIGAELVGSLLAVFAILAGWGKPRWLQWVGVGGMFVQNIWFFLFYTLDS